MVPFSVSICKTEWETVISKDRFNKKGKTRSEAASRNRRWFSSFTFKEFSKEITFIRQESPYIKKYWLRNEETEKIKHVACKSLKFLKASC